MAKNLTCPKCGSEDIETTGWELWHKNIMVNAEGKIVSAEPASSADTVGGLINDSEELHCIECDHNWSLSFATSADDVLIRSSAVAAGFIATD